MYRYILTTIHFTDYAVNMLLHRVLGAAEAGAMATPLSSAFRISKVRVSQTETVREGSARDQSGCAKEDATKAWCARGGCAPRGLSIRRIRRMAITDLECDDVHFAVRPRVQTAAALVHIIGGLSMDDDKRSSPWLTVTEAADRARCGVRLIYREVRASRLRAARVGGRRELRIRAEWIDTWLDAYTTPQEIVK